LVWGDYAFVVPNVAADGTQFFIMDEQIVRQLYTRMMIAPSGVWHSHPGGTPEPSEADLLYHPRGMRMFIVCNGEVYDHGIPG
jgi:proteasome lid subunit RPN8/RPN11